MTNSSSNRSVPLLVCSILVLCSILVVFAKYSDFLANIDISIANMLFDDDDRTWKYSEITLVRILNDYVDLIGITIILSSIIIPLIILKFIQCSHKKLTLTKTPFMKDGLWLGLAPVLSAGLGALIVEIFKPIIGRPRPRQTTLFCSNDDMACAVEFMAIFQGTPAVNPCDKDLLSTPSGHAQFYTAVAVSPLLPLLMAMRRTGHRDYRGSCASRWFLACLCPLFVMGGLALTFGGAAARWAAGAHFLTDTLTSMILSWSCFLLALAFMPAAPDYPYRPRQLHLSRLQADDIVLADLSDGDDVLDIM